MTDGPLTVSVPGSRVPQSFDRLECQRVDRIDGLKTYSMEDRSQEILLKCDRYSMADWVQDLLREARGAARLLTSHGWYARI